MCNLIFLCDGVEGRMFEITLLNIQLLYEDGFILNRHFYTIKGNMFSPDTRKRYRKCFWR